MPQTDPAALLQSRMEAEDALLHAVAAADAAAADAALGQLLPLCGPAPAALRAEAQLLNALLCRTLRRCRVHPRCAEPLYARTAAAIDHAAARPAALPAVIAATVQEYCRYVRRYARCAYCPAVQKAADYIDGHLDAVLTPRALAAHCHLTPGYFSELFKQQTGAAPAAYIDRRRMEHAAHLLRTGDAPITEIAAQVGMLDSSYFSRRFKRATGLTPTRYRQLHRPAPQTNPQPA